MTTHRVLLLSLGIALAPALAKGPQVQVQAILIHASMAQGAIDPSLASMREALSKKTPYKTLTRLDVHALELSSSPVRLNLPNGKVAEFTLVSVKDNIAQVHAKVPPLEAIYMLARARSLYIEAGKQDDGDLWLVLAEPPSP